MAWMVEHNKFDPRQKEVFESKIDKNLWIKGFAGSGKSIVLIHKLQKLLEDNSNLQVCVVVYTWSMIDMFKTGMKSIGFPDTIPVITYLNFEKQSPDQKYDYIFCDEVQDLPESTLMLMKNKLKPNGKIVVSGDSNQSIWPNRVDPGQIGIILNADEVGLTYIHRVTRTIINAVQKLIPATNMWSAGKEHTPPDRSILLCQANREEEEVEYIYKEALKGPDSSAGDRQETSVILIPTHDDITKFSQLLLKQLQKPLWIEKKDNFGKNPDYVSLNAHFKANDVRIQYVGNSNKNGSLQNAESQKDIILMTYHSSKGLDFSNVFLPFFSWDLYIDRYKPDTLLMVAMTRSKKNLCISYTGNLHHKIELLRSDSAIDITEISVTPPKKNNSVNDEIDLGF
jgi:superfamily I DNA/RNA helicase